MAKSPEPTKIKVEIKGEEHVGSFDFDDQTNTITVVTSGAAKSAKVGEGSPEEQAEVLLRELIANKKRPQER